MLKHEWKAKLALAIAEIAEVHNVDLGSLINDVWPLLNEVARLQHKATTKALADKLLSDEIFVKQPEI